MSIEEFIDAALDFAIIVTLSVLLLGCGTTPTITSTIDKPRFHPAWPLPTEVCNATWLIELDDNSWPIVGVKYPENLDLKACNKDKIRYIKQLTTLACHYRPKDDPHCVIQEKD